MSGMIALGGLRVKSYGECFSYYCDNNRNYNRR